MSNTDTASSQQDSTMYKQANNNLSFRFTICGGERRAGERGEKRRKLINTKDWTRVGTKMTFIFIVSLKGTEVLDYKDKYLL